MVAQREQFRVAEIRQRLAEARQAAERRQTMMQEQVAKAVAKREAFRADLREVGDQRASITRRITQFGLAILSTFKVCKTSPSMSFQFQ